MLRCGLAVWWKQAQLAQLQERMVLLASTSSMMGEVRLEGVMLCYGFAGTGKRSWVSELQERMAELASTSSMMGDVRCGCVAVAA
jgi:hypothetical protein